TENDHPALFEVAHSPPTDERFADLLHFDGCEEPCFYFEFFECILEGHAIDDGCEHAHIVGLHAVHPCLFGTEPPINVSATDYDGDFHPLAVYFLDVFGVLGYAIDVNAVLLVAHEGFSAEFE